MSLNDLIDYINSKLRTRTDASQPRVDAGVLREVFGKIVGIGPWMGFSTNTNATTPDETISRGGRTILGLNEQDDTSAPLQVNYTVSPLGILLSLLNKTPLGSAVAGALLQFTRKDVGFWRIGMPGDQNVLVFGGWDGQQYVERARITADGRVLVGQTVANDRDKLQVNGPISGLYNEQDHDPTAGELPVKSWRIVKNTQSGAVYLCVNDNGTLKKTTLQ